MKKERERTVFSLFLVMLFAMHSYETRERVVMSLLCKRYDMIAHLTSTWALPNHHDAKHLITPNLPERAIIT